MQRRVHILSTVNAGAVSKAGSTYTIRDVCGAVDGIVMNRMLYPADQLASGVVTLNHKPCPAGHPKDAQGRFISASDGPALFAAYAGAHCVNARHEAGRTLVDVVVNEAQARAHPDGLKLVERLDSAIAGTNSEPIHVSTGLMCEPITANGESGGKSYDRVATRINYDHLAFLLNEQGAGTPAQGVGMFVNAAGQAEEVEQVAVNTAPEDKRAAGFIGWLKKLVGNSELSFDQISSGLYTGLPDGGWVQEVYARYAIWRDRDGEFWQQDYAVSKDGSVAWSGTAEKVRREVTYKSVTNMDKGDIVKETILAALNAAGISGVAAMTDAQLQAAYNALIERPLREQLTAANSKIAGFELAANATAEAELTALAAELAVNTSLKPEDFKAMGLVRCKELKTNTMAAPIVVGNAGSGGGADEFAGYSLNSHMEAK